MVTNVRDQYERFPYPPLPWLALPARGAGRELGLAYGRQLVKSTPFAQSFADSGHPRILVAGCGTFEPLAVALANPEAAEIVAVDFSSAALAQLSKRIKIAGLIAGWSPRRRGASRVPLRLVHADLFDWEDGQFDFILASNVLHHVREPAQLLNRLAQWLRPGGLFRLVTYAKHSRLWLRSTGAWLELNGLAPGDPHLARRARSIVARLPRHHPIRGCFASHVESGTATGIVDAFLHQCENPLSALEWGQVAAQSGLCIVAEAQNILSRSTFLHELAAPTRSLSRWQCLQILDDLLELAANPVYWFVKGSPCHPSGRSDWAVPANFSAPPRGAGRSILDSRLPPDEVELDGRARQFVLPSAAYAEMGAGLRRARDLLASIDVDVRFVLDRLREEVGPRVARQFPNRKLFGLTLNEYDREALLRATTPWSSRHWQQLQWRYPGACIVWRGKTVAGATLATQAQRLQLEHGPFAPELEISLLAGT